MCSCLSYSEPPYRRGLSTLTAVSPIVASINEEKFDVYDELIFIRENTSNPLSARFTMEISHLINYLCTLKFNRGSTTVCLDLAICTFKCEYLLCTYLTTRHLYLNCHVYKCLLIDYMICAYDEYHIRIIWYTTGYITYSLHVGTFLVLLVSGTKKLNSWRTLCQPLLHCIFVYYHIARLWMIRSLLDKYRTFFWAIIF